MLEDLFSGGPPGVWAASFVAAYALVDRQRDTFAGLSGIGAILGFAAAMLVGVGARAYVIVVDLLRAAAADCAADRGDRGERCSSTFRLRCCWAVIHRRLVGPLAERFLMPLFDRKDKSRYATFYAPHAAGHRRHDVRCSRRSPGGSTSFRSSKASEFMTRAEDNRVNQRLLAPLRGRIIDRFGVELATNRRNYRVLLVPEQATEGVDAALDTLGKLILITDRQRERILHDIAQNKRFVPVTGRGESRLGRFRAHQSASALSARHPARCRRDARLSFRRRACRTCWAMSPRFRRKT